MELQTPEFNEQVTPSAIMDQLMKISHNKLATRMRWQLMSDVTPRVLTWGKSFLAAHFVHEPSLMHLWLGDELNSLHKNRGSKVNLIGPRGSAKSTIATLCYVLRAAVGGWERYIWIVSDTKEQAQPHLENVKSELTGNKRLAEYYPTGVGQGRHWRATSIELANGVVIESFGTGQRIRGRRHGEVRPSLIVCDDLQNDSHMSSAGQREASRQWFHGTLLNAGTHETNIINLATALHREALALELHRSAGWNSRSFPAIISWPTNTEMWDCWESIYCDVENPNARADARQFYDDHRSDMDAGATVLWPDGENLYTLMQLRAEIGQTAFEREKQGSPVNPENCEWPEAYFAETI